MQPSSTLKHLAAIFMALMLQSFAPLYGQFSSGEVANAQENRPTGSWADYLPYDQTEELTYCESNSTGTAFWAVRTRQALFLFHEEDNSLQRLTTVEGMSGSNPTALAWDADGEILIVGYASFEYGCLALHFQ